MNYQTPLSQNIEICQCLADKLLLVRVWENLKKLWKHSPAARVPGTAFLILPNFHLCFYNWIET